VPPVFAKIVIINVPVLQVQTVLGLFELSIVKNRIDFIRTTQVKLLIAHFFKNCKPNLAVEPVLTFIK
jgi:hypothetical protein